MSVVQLCHATGNLLTFELQIGQSLFDAAGSEKVASLIEKAKQRNIKIVFPVDFITADKFDKDATVSA